MMRPSVGCQRFVRNPAPVQAACATKFMEGGGIDLDGPEGIIVVARGNIESRAERVASGKNARYHG